MGRTRSGLCLASTCALIIAEGHLLVKGFSEVSEKIFVLSAIPNPLGRYRACLFLKAPDQISGDGRHSTFDIVIIPYLCYRKRTKMLQLC